jgi:hypothetical protein
MLRRDAWCMPVRGVGITELSCDQVLSGVVPGWPALEVCRGLMILHCSTLGLSRTLVGKAVRNSFASMKRGKGYDTSHLRGMTGWHSLVNPATQS